MDSTEARLYGKHDSIAFYMQSVRNFLIQELDQYLEFPKYVRNILDWGKNLRSKNIPKAMVVARKKRDKMEDSMREDLALSESKTTRKK